MPVEGEEGGRPRRKLSLPATEFEDPLPFHVDSKGELPWLWGRRLSLMLKFSWFRLTEERETREEGSDRREGGRELADFIDMGGRSAP